MVSFGLQDEKLLSACFCEWRSLYAVWTPWLDEMTNLSDLCPPSIGIRFTGRALLFKAFRQHVFIHDRCKSRVSFRLISCWNNNLTELPSSWLLELLPGSCFSCPQPCCTSKSELVAGEWVLSPMSSKVNWCVDIWPHTPTHRQPDRQTHGFIGTNDPFPLFVGQTQSPSSIISGGIQSVRKHEGASLKSTFYESTGQFRWRLYIVTGYWPRAVRLGSSKNRLRTLS